MSTIKAAFRRFAQDETGATMVEYALMVALVAAVCVVAVTALGTAISGTFTSVAAKV
jgi:pilus assembly protein Flp/PilA